MSRQEQSRLNREQKLLFIEEPIYQTFNHQQRYLQNSTLSSGQEETSALNYASTAIFIVAFLILAVLIKRYLSRFISFYVLHRHYKRMKCIQQQPPIINNDIDPASSPQLNINDGGGAATLGENLPMEKRGMTIEEIKHEYRRALHINLRTYHPILEIIPTKVSRLRDTMRLPRSIICTLMIASLIITITASLALNQYCASSEGSETGIPQDSIFAIVAVVSAALATFLTYVLSKNYFEFLHSSRVPVPATGADEQSYQIKLDEDPHSRQDASNKSSSPINSVVQHIRQKSGELSQVTPMTLTGTLPPIQLKQQQQDLFSIKEDEDDEEQPLSPEKHSNLDDIGSDEIAPGRQHEVGSILPPIGIIRMTATGDFQNALITKKGKNQKRGGNFDNNNRMTLGHEFNDNTQHNSKSISHSDVSNQGDDIVIEDVKDENGSERGNTIGSRMQARSERSSQRFDPGALNHSKSGITPGRGLTSAGGQAGPSDTSTGTIDQFYGWRNKNIFLTPSGIITDQLGRRLHSREKGADQQTDFPGHSRFNSNLINTASDQQAQNTTLSNILVAIAALILLGVILSPIYVVHRLSNLSYDSLQEVLLTFVYSILFDYLALRLVVIFLYSLCQAKLKLMQRHYQADNFQRWEIPENQLIHLGHFYEDYEFHFTGVPSSSDESHGGYETNTPLGVGRAVSSEEGDLEGGNTIDNRIIRSADSQNSNKRLLKHHSSPSDAKPVHRVHYTRCTDVFLLEMHSHQPFFPKANITPGITGKTPSPKQNKQSADQENLANTSQRLIGSEKQKSLSSKYENVYSRQPDDDEFDNGNGRTLKILRPPSEVYLNQGNQSMKYENNPADDIEEIAIDSGNKRGRNKGQFSTNYVAADTSLIGQDPHSNTSVVPPINMSRMSDGNNKSNYQQQYDQYPPIRQHQQTSSQYQEFETPKLSPDHHPKVGVQLIKGKKSNASSEHASNNTQQNPGQNGSDREQNVSQQQDRKKQLLRDLILEGSSSDSKKKMTLQNNSGSREEYRSLQKYLANENHNDPQEHHIIESQEDIFPLEAPQNFHIMNDSANMWHPEKQSEFKRDPNDQFSPQYSSGAKSSSQNQIMSKQTLQEKQSQLKAQLQELQQNVNVANKDAGSVQRTLKDSYKGTISNGFSGAEEVAGSFVQAGNNNVRSSSHHTNLLRSVLSQNRDQENCDFSEIIKGHSPKEYKRGRASLLGKSYNSPIGLKDREHIESSQSKRKKYGSIIVQPDLNSSIGGITGQQQQQPHYVEVRVLEEEEDQQRTAEDNGAFVGSPLANFDGGQTTNNPMSIIQFYNEADRMPKEEQFQDILRMKSGENQEPKLSERNPISQASTPGSGRHPPLKPNLGGGSSRRGSKEDSFRRKEKAYKMAQDQILYQITEADEFEAARISRQGNSFMKIHPDFGEGGASNTNSTKEIIGKGGFFSQPQKPDIKPKRKSKNRVHPMKKGSYEEAPVIVEEGTLESKNDTSTPTPSPPKVVRGRGKAPKDKKVINFAVLNDNSLVGDAPTEAAELTALRRSKLETTTGNKSLRPGPLNSEDLTGTDSSNTQEMEVTKHRRHQSNQKASTKPSNKVGAKPRDSASMGSNRVSAFQKSLITFEGPKIQVPVVYNLHLKEKEEEKRKVDEQEINLIRMEEQHRQLKKFLQLSRQLRKGQDEKKIKELMTSMKESGRPLPLHQINELRMLELMSSPYSQPLMGMIKQIEKDYYSKKEYRPKSTAPRQKSSKQFSRTDGLSTLGSNRVDQAAGVYGQNGIIQQSSGAQSSALSRLSLSRESEASVNLQNQNRGGVKMSTPSKKARSPDMGSGKHQRRMSPLVDEIMGEPDTRVMDMDDVLIVDHLDPSSSSQGSRFNGLKSGSSKDRQSSKQSKKKKGGKKGSHDDGEDSSKNASSHRSRFSKSNPRVAGGFMSQYSSINQVLIEHEHEESFAEVSARGVQNKQGSKIQEIQAVEIEDDIDQSSMEI